MSFLFLSAAWATTVAVLDFDGYGTTWNDLAEVDQGVRDAFLEDGRLDPLSGSDIADGVSKGQDSSLRRARELYAQARRSYDGGDVAAAIPALTEAIRLHTMALSDVGRRSEFADAHSLLGQCLVKSGRSLEAKEEFGAAALLNPSFVGNRAPLSAASADLARSAIDVLQKAPRRKRDNDEVDTIRSALGVDYVVTGWLEADGRLTATLYGERGALVQAHGQLTAMPAPTVDDAYAALARELADGMGSGGMAAEEETVVVADDEELTDEPIEAVAKPKAKPAAKTSTTKPKPAAAKPSKPARVVVGRKTSDAEPVAKRDRSTMKYAEGPITDRWWFWAGIAGVAAGGGVAAIAALTVPEPTVVHEPDEWTVSVQTE